MYSWHAYIIALGYKMIYVIMIIEGYSDGGGTLNSSNFQSKTDPSQFMSSESKSNAIQKPENHYFPNMCQDGLWHIKIKAINMLIMLIKQD